MQARPAGGGVESQDPGRDKIAAGMGPGQLVILTVYTYVMYVGVCVCVHACMYLCKGK